MSHRQQMQREIKAALNAMPQGMTPRDMVHLFADLIIQYNMAPNTSDIVFWTTYRVERHVDLWGHEDQQTDAAIRDADQFLARIQAGDQA